VDGDTTNGLSLGRQPYLRRTLIMRMWFEVSNALTRSSSNIQVGRLWLCLRCNNFIIVKSLSEHPTPGVDPNCYLTPYLYDSKQSCAQ